MNKIIDETKIQSILDSKLYANDAGRIRAILQKSLELKGLDIEEVATLSQVKDPDLLQEIFLMARRVKEDIYGKRLVLFAPLYISNVCGNECLYCAFRSQNSELTRRELTQEEIANETRLLIDQGHKRVLLVAGENYRSGELDYILESIDTIYATKSFGFDKQVANGSGMDSGGFDFAPDSGGLSTGGEKRSQQRVTPKCEGSIRRINTNIAPLSKPEFARLKEAKIGTYILFQETYHRDIYRSVHLRGRKADYDWRLFAIDRAMEAGIDDVGLGVLFGLADWRFDLLALLQHISYLENRFGVGPHTISVPRLEPAHGSVLASSPNNPVSDFDFFKIIAILRLAVPYTGIILSTRESASLRREAFALGVSQISAGSRTNPGGYGEGKRGYSSSQFALGDSRSLDEVVLDVLKMGYMPSFCTSCYRLGRTGEVFMAHAKSANIKTLCTPNALVTLQEYLINYASEETNSVGMDLIAKEIAALEGVQKDRTLQLIAKVKAGKRDVFL